MVGELICSPFFLLIFGIGLCLPDGTALNAEQLFAKTRPAGNLL